MMSNNSFLPSNHSQLDCPVFTDQELYLINQFNVWIEGVTQTCVAIPGFLGKYKQKKYLFMLQAFDFRSSSV